jgi:hypothetical protein
MTEQEALPSTSSVEWRLLQALRSHRTRLRYKLEYQPLEDAPQTEVDTAFENAVGFFDAGVRDILTRGDLEDLITTDLGLENQKTQIQLRSLCTLLDGLVDTDLVSSPQLLQQDSHVVPYQNLNALTRLLGNTHWGFEVVTGQS